MTYQLYAAICINCGLPEYLSKQDITGCSRETELEHDFQRVDARPFKDWSFDDVQSRLRRAVTKAASSAATAQHFAHCPEAGAGSYTYKLYRQKTIKRNALASALIDELQARSQGR